MALLSSPASTLYPAHPPDLLLVDSSPETARYAAILRNSYRVATTSSGDVAKQFLQRNPPSLVITELELEEADGVEVCREAKALAVPPPVLITTADAERVPDVLAAGCDAVLLKPFAPNLLYARIGRLMRARTNSSGLRTRSDELRERLNTTRSKLRHLADRRALCENRAIVEWPNTHCPYCDHAGVTMFDYASIRRAWYACLECKKVWIAKRKE